MVRFLLRVLLLLLLVWLLHRFWSFLTGSVKSGGGLPHREPHGEEMVLDLECQTHIPRTDALTAVVDGKKLYFCSRECRDAYLARISSR